MYYVEAPPGCGPITFYTPLDEDHFFPLPCVRNSWRSAVQADVQPEPGMLLLFRSWLKHTARPNNVDGRRVSISFNSIFLPPGALPG